MEVADYKIQILDLAQRWRMDLLSETERDKLEIWFRSLEDRSLGVPIELSIGELEKRLYQMFEGSLKEPEKEGGPPYPFK